MAFSPSDLSGPLTAFALHEQSEPMSAGERESASVVAAAAMLPRVFELFQSYPSPPVATQKRIEKPP
jgi:hypothetical protein